MTQREIAKWILEHGGCGRAFHPLKISCQGLENGINCGTDCPCFEGDFDCDKFEHVTEAAQAWLEKNGEDVCLD